MMGVEGHPVYGSGKDGGNVPFEWIVFILFALGAIYAAKEFL